MRQAWQWTEIKQKHRDLKIRFFRKFSEIFPPKNIHSSENFKIIFVQVIIWTVKMAPEYENLSFFCIQVVKRKFLSESEAWILLANTSEGSSDLFLTPKPLRSVFLPLNS